MKINEFTLETLLGEGAFGAAYLTKKEGDNNLYATKMYDREKVKEGSQLYKYMTQEINIMKQLKHPNIVKFIDCKKTKKHFYIVTEFCNGGELGKALEDYKLKKGKAFPEEIVQYLMKQIISAFKYMHDLNIMHRDIKLENILLNFDNEEDKKNLNMMKSQVKIIDFGFSCKITKDNLRITAIGSPLNADPLILQKLTKGGKTKDIGYGKEADIWSLGNICYEMLIGESAFSAEEIDELVSKIEEGKYNVPTDLSKEVVSFLNGMLQYDPKKRLTIDQLYNHPFIRNSIDTFHKINLTQVSSHIKGGNLQINTKKNQTIWAIFNKEDEDKLMTYGNLESIPEEPIIQHQVTQQIGNQIQNEPIKNVNTFDSKNYPNLGNNYQMQYNQINQMYMGPVLPRGMSGIPGNSPDPNWNAQITDPNYFNSGYGFSPGSIYGQ